MCWTGNGGLDGRKHSSRLKPSQGWTWCNANNNLRTKLSLPGTSIKISHYSIPRGTQNTSVLIQFSSIQSLSRVWLFATLWTVAHQASLSITNSWRLLKLMSIESVMPSNHIIFCRPILLLPSVFPSIRVLSKSQFFALGGQSTGVSASASVLPMNIQDWFPLGWTGWLSLQFKGL